MNPSSPDVVLFSPGAMDGDAPRGSYVVLLCLPDDGIGFQYSIKSAHDAHERVVREQRLKAGRIGAPPAAGEPALSLRA